MAGHVTAVRAAGWLSGLLCILLGSLGCAGSQETSHSVPSRAEMEAILQSDPYLRQLAVRLASLSDAERTSVAQQELDRYFHQHVPLFHLLNSVPNRQGQQSTLAGKRGLDFGVSRGFSAARAAQLRMALRAVTNPHSPGR